MSRVRVGTVVAGVLVALGALVVLALGGVGADRNGHRTVGPLRPVDLPRTATQPELERALLAKTELPPGFVPSPPVSPATPPGVRLITECTELFEHLGGDTGVTREARGPSGSTLTQSVRVVPTPAESVQDARRLATHCRRFTAALDDGTRVVVEMAPAALLGSPSAPPDQETVAIRLRVVSDQRTLEGYLTLGRMGRVVSVLRQLGPPGTITVTAVQDTLRRALDKLVPLVTRPA